MLEFSEIQKQLLSTFSDRGIKVACAESCTGGMISSALTDLPGSSKIFDRGTLKGFLGANIASASKDKEMKKYLKEILNYPRWWNW